MHGNKHIFFSFCICAHIFVLGYISPILNELSNKKHLKKTSIGNFMPLFITSCCICIYIYLKNYLLIVIALSSLQRLLVRTSISWHFL